MPKREEALIESERDFWIGMSCECSNLSSSKMSEGIADQVVKQSYTGAVGGLLSTFPCSPPELGNFSSSSSSSSNRSSCLMSIFDAGLVTSLTCGALSLSWFPSTSLTLSGLCGGASGTTMSSSAAAGKDVLPIAVECGIISRLRQL